MQCPNTIGANEYSLLCSRDCSSITSGANQVRNINHGNSSFELHGMRLWLLGEDRLLGGKGVFTARVAEGQSCFFMAKESKTAHATGRFLLVLYLFIASAPESL